MKTIYLYVIALLMVSSCKNESKTDTTSAMEETSIEETNSKSDGELDPSPVAQTQFSKNLKLQDIEFTVTGKPVNGNTEVSIMPKGPEMQSDVFTQSINGTIVDAEVEDLNSDGSPEILVFTKNKDGKGDVIAYSGNNNKSMSMVYLPPITDNPKASEGYNGNDEFALVETSLVRSFPVQGTAKTRQIQYKLVNGENGRIFEIANVSEY